MHRICTLLVCLSALFSAEAATPAPVTLDAEALAGRSRLIAALALPAGAWQEIGVKVIERTSERTAITIAGERFLGAVKAAKDAPDVPAQRALTTFVRALTSEARPTKADDLDPVFARRAVRGGALRKAGADAAAVTVLEKAVAEAATMRPTTAFSGPKNSRLEERRDAFGVGGWVLSGERTAFAVEHKKPEFALAPRLTLVVDLPAKSDPVAETGKAISASVLHGTTTLATWTAADGKLTADGTAWRAVVREQPGRGMAKGLLPAHLVLTGLDGDPIRLATVNGSVVPARDGTPAETERFLNESIKALPDTAHQDLVGEYLFTYVYDSPDPRFPFIIGNSEIKGDIHQTAAQTLSATTGGQCRGDCDDLAELYQTMAERQGRMGHLLILPSHTAFASAHQEGTDWVVEVMQTGPTLAFRDPDAANALRAAHAHFDANAPFSPDQVGLLLRFSGENQRGPFQLGWRIFTEPAYARTMIDVQRDWQYQTYARAISKMEKLIASGDRDPANLGELAGLLRATGQWGAAAKAYRGVADAVKDPVSQFQERMNLAGILRRDGKKDEAKAVLKDLVTSLEELRPKVGKSYPELVMRLSQALLGAGDAEGARAVFISNAFSPIAQLTSQIAQLVSSPRFNRESWTGDSRFSSIRRIEQLFAACLMAHLERAGAAADKDPFFINARTSLDLWLAKFAFLEATAEAEAIGIYATAARIHALDLKHEELVKAVLAAKTPTAAKRDHVTRPDGPASAARESDLSWIRISPAFWLGEMSRALRGSDDDEDESAAPAMLDPSRVNRVRLLAAAKHANDAYQACRKLNLIDASLDNIDHFAGVIGAIASNDDKALRARLKHVKRENDKRLRDTTATQIGQLAPLCDDKQWQAVLKAWADEVDYKPKWFLIAWTAAVVGAPNHALSTARMAAARFKDDSAFTEEAQFMEKLLRK